MGFTLVLAVFAVLAIIVGCHGVRVFLSMARRGELTPARLLFWVVLPFVAAGYYDNAERARRA